MLCYIFCVSTPFCITLFFVCIEFDYEAVDTTVLGLTGVMVDSSSLELNAYQDGEAEQLEGFVLFLEIAESELDPRDVGNVSVSRSAYLVRINQSGTVVTLIKRFHVNAVPVKLMFCITLQCHLEILFSMNSLMCI